MPLYYTGTVMIPCVFWLLRNQEIATPATQARNDLLLEGLSRPSQVRLTPRQLSQRESQVRMTDGRPYGCVGWWGFPRACAACCGARHLRCRQNDFLSCRPLPLAQVAYSATGSAPIAPPRNNPIYRKAPAAQMETSARNNIKRKETPYAWQDQNHFLSK